MFQFLENYYLSMDINKFSEDLITYSRSHCQVLNQDTKTSISPSKLEQEESALSNKAKKPSSNSDDSDDEFDESDDSAKIKKLKERTKSECVDLRRASFSDYYKFVKEDLLKTGSVDDLDLENRIIAEVKSHMEMSKIDTPHKGKTPKDNNKIVYI